MSIDGNNGYGFSITTIEFINKLYHRGDCLALVDVPVNDTGLDVKIGSKSDIILVNKLTISGKYPLFHIDTIKKFDLELNQTMIDGLMAINFCNGNYSVLDQLVKKN